MNNVELAGAVEAVADSICKGITKYGNELSGEPIAAVCMSVADDFTSATLFAASSSVLDEMEWDVHDWSHSAPDVDISSLKTILGEVFVGETSNLETSANWLAALTKALATAADKSELSSQEVKPYMFCHVNDSEEFWFTHLSAKRLTDSDVFEAHSDDVAECFDVDDDPLTLGNPELRVAYEKSLANMLT